MNVSQKESHRCLAIASGLGMYLSSPCCRLPRMGFPESGSSADEGGLSVGRRREGWWGREGDHFPIARPIGIE